jgi:hypothetical protein
MVLLHDVDQVEARFGPFVDSVIIDARQVHSLWNVQYVWKSFWTHRMELLGYVGQVEAILGLFGDVVHLGTG